MEVLLEHLDEELLDEVIEELEAGDESAVAKHLAGLHDAEIAALLEALPPDERDSVWELIPDEREAEVLTYLHDEARTGIMEDMEPEELAAVVEAMEPEDLAEVLEELPDELTESILRALDVDHKQRLDAVRSFPEDSAGRLMSRDVVSVRQDVTLAVVLRWLRRKKALPAHTDALMVTTEEGRYLGKLSVTDIVTRDPDALVAEVMKAGADAVSANETEDRLLGRITVDDVVDVIREEADHALLSHAGLDEEEDLFAPVVPSAKRRGFWLGINLITVFLAA